MHWRSKVAPNRDHPNSNKDSALPQGSGVHIMHERPAPETEPHVIAPLIVALSDGRRLTARKWSLAGIRDQVLIGENLTGARLMIPFQGIEVGFPIRLARSADGNLWVFEALTGRQREALGLFYRNLMTGKMASTDDVITALDTPVDLVPMGETEEEKAAGQAKVQPRLMRVVLNVLWYVGLAIFLFIFLGNLVWTKIDGLPLSHARVFAQRAELRAPSEGYLQVASPEGARVREGTALARMYQPEADLALQDAQARLDLLQQRMQEARERLDLHLSLRSKVRTSVERLYSPTALDRFDAGISNRPGDFNDQRQALEQNLRSCETDHDRAQSELRRLQQLQRFIEVTAPSAGQVIEWLARDQQFVRAGEVVGTFETEGPRVVRAWMDDRMATRVHLGMSAEISLQADGETRVLTGRVVGVDAGENPATPGQFGLIVTVATVGLSDAQTRSMMRFNAPIDVVVKRNLLAGWPILGD